MEPEDSLACSQDPATWPYFQLHQSSLRPTTSQAISRRVRKIAKSDYYFRHVRLSVRMEKLCSQRTDFDENWYLISIKNLARKFKFH